jgi:hypothetical protein
MITFLKQHAALIPGLIALAISVFELLRTGQKIVKIGWNGWVNIFLSLGAKNRQPVDASHLLISPPPVARKNIEALKSIGFRRLGEAQVKALFRPPLTVWIFTHLESQIQAEASGKRVGFSTYFQEKVLVVTDFPNGEHIEIPNYQSHTIVTNVGDAYNYHKMQIAKFGQKYGQPHPIRNMSDYLHWEGVGRKYYATRKLMRWVWSNIIRLAAFIYGCLVLFLAPTIFPPRGFSSLSRLSGFSSEEILIYTIILLLMPAIFTSRYFNRWTVQQTHKDSRIISRKNRTDIGSN